MSRKEKLVIFVGAGVSKNSHVPTWGEVIKEYAQRLNYTQCLNCLFKKEGCEAHCLYKYRFSNDEYLKIPQYFYSQDKSLHHQDYYQILLDGFDHDFKSNILDELIVSLNPDHIITTNYDHLLDDYDYEVISSDCDLLRAKSNHYLIKMHGDISNVREIVFKEDDYLDYSQTHSLMELYIRSLLINHSFLFVGYSLNDYNLKTFMSWIDYIGQEKQVSDRPKHYLITNDILPDQDYLIAYYRQKNIEVINLNDLSDDLLIEADEVNLEDEIGRKTYVCLRHLK